MTKQTQVETYVQSTSKPKSILKYFIYGTFFVGLPAFLIIGTATKPERLDMAKEQILDGQKVNYTEIENQQKKIRQAKYAIAYYCEDNPNDEKCPRNDYNDDRRINPLGELKEVSYEPKNYIKAHNKPFSWKSDIAPPMPKSGLGQSVNIISVKKTATKKIQSNKNHDTITQIIAENNIKNLINKGY